MKTLILLLALMLSGCATMLPDKSPTKLEKSPCACGVRAGRHA